MRKTSFKILITFKNFLNLNKLTQLNIAYSGGIDSLVLLHLATKHSGLPVYAIHVDHKERFDSTYQALQCEKIAIQMGAHFQGYTLEDNVFDKSEFNLASKRYAYFEKFMNEYKTDNILLGHHMNDQIETFLMRLIRSPSISGLSPAKKEKDGHYYRPLLNFTKEDLIGYLEDHDLIHLVQEDSTNKTDLYYRNRVRNEILPLLLKENPNFLNAISVFQSKLEDADELINDMAKEIIWEKDDFYIIYLSDNPRLKNIVFQNAIVQCLNHFKVKFNNNIIDEISSMPMIASSNFNRFYPTKNLDQKCKVTYDCINQKLIFTGVANET